MRGKIICLAAIGSLLPAACMSPREGTYHQEVVKAEANVYPQNYKSEILAFLRTYLNDPTQIRGAFISEPELRPAGPEKRYAVCLRFNARKSSGDYEGSKERAVYFLAGRLDTMIEAKRDQCSGAIYQPFPELERLGR